MLIHSTTLTIENLERAASRCGLMLRPGATLTNGPRSRRLTARIERQTARRNILEEMPPAMQAKIAGLAPYHHIPFPGETRRTRNASWIEHGHWIAEIFSFDPHAVIDTKWLNVKYSGVDDFHEQTEQRFKL